MFRSFDDVLAFLDRLGLFAMDFALHRMERALTALQLDQTADWNPYIVQIVGTNGKGSTATFLASLGQAHGVRTGLYTSPHFVTPRERIRIDGALPEPETLVPLANQVHTAAPDLTYFEFLTVLGLAAFRAAGVELVVLEAGLGGRYDATTAMRADAVAFVPIDLDHTKLLGATLTAIADEKSCAMRPGRPALTAPQSCAVLDVLRQRARERNCPLLEPAAQAELPARTRLGLAGPHQRVNARLALATWRVAAEARGWPARPEAVLTGLGQAFIPGRFQRIPAVGKDPALILDGGHNPHGLTACREAVRTGNVHPRAVIFSCLADKAVDAMLPLVLEMAQGAPLLVCTIQDNERALSGEELAGRFTALDGMKQGALPVSVLALPRLSVALEEAGRLPNPDAPVLICGSLYLLGEFFTLRPRWLQLDPLNA